MNGDKDKPQNKLGRWIDDTNDGFAKWYQRLRPYVYRVPSKPTEKRQARRWRRRLEKDEIRKQI